MFAAEVFDPSRVGAVAGIQKVEVAKEAEPVPERQHGGQCNEFASPEGCHGRCSSSSWFGQVTWYINLSNWH